MKVLMLKDTAEVPQPGPAGCLDPSSRKLVEVCTLTVKNGVLLVHAILVPSFAMTTIANQLNQFLLLNFQHVT